MTTYLTSRDFNQDTGGAKRAAEQGPVIITVRGRPSHVLLTYDEFERLRGPEPSIIELLGEPAGIEDVDFEVPVDRSLPTPASFE